MMMANSTSLPLNRGGQRLTLVGRSRAGDGTCFIIPEMKWMFDCGALVAGMMPTHIFLSHTHSDHSCYLTHSKNIDKPPLVYMPEKAVRFVDAYIHAHQEMSDCACEAEAMDGGRYQKSLDFVPKRPGDEFVIRKGSTRYTVRAVECDHRIDCLGYSIFREKQQLKEQYKGLPGRELGRLRKEGVEITTSFSIPVVCFLGDTTPLVFERHPEILKEHEVIVVECSFFRDELENAIQTRHMHWSQLEPLVRAHPKVLFVLIHFSLRYSSLEIREFFSAQNIQNVHPMLVEEEIQREVGLRRNDKEKSVPCCSCFACNKSSTK